MGKLHIVLKVTDAVKFPPPPTLKIRHKHLGERWNPADSRICRFTVYNKSPWRGGFHCTHCVHWRYSCRGRLLERILVYAHLHLERVLCMTTYTWRGFFAWPPTPGEGSLHDHLNLERVLCMTTYTWRGFFAWPPTPGEGSLHDHLHLERVLCNDHLHLERILVHAHLHLERILVHAHLHLERILVHAHLHLERILVHAHLHLERILVRAHLHLERILVRAHLHLERVLCMTTYTWRGFLCMPTYTWRGFLCMLTYTRRGFIAWPPTPGEGSLHGRLYLRGLSFMPTISGEDSCACPTISRKGSCVPNYSWEVSCVPTYRRWDSSVCPHIQSSWEFLSKSTIS